MDPRTGRAIRSHTKRGRQLLGLKGKRITKKGYDGTGGQIIVHGPSRPELQGRPFGSRGRGPRLDPDRPRRGRRITLAPEERIALGPDRWAMGEEGYGWAGDTYDDEEVRQLMNIGIGQNSIPGRNYAARGSGRRGRGGGAPVA